MISRKFIMLAAMLAVLVVGTATTVGAEQLKNPLDKNHGNDHISINNSFEVSIGPGSSSPANISGGVEDLLKNASDALKASPTALVIPTPRGIPAPGLPDNGLNISNISRPIDSVLNATHSVHENATPATDHKFSTEKNQAERTIRQTQTQLEAYKNRVNNSRLTTSDKARLIAEADRNIDWYMQADDAVQSASNITEVQKIETAIEQHNKLLKADLKKTAGLLACDELDDKISTARNVSRLAGEKIAALNAKGNDTARLEQLLSDYDSHVDAAASHATAARADFESITTDNADNRFTNGYNELKRADRELSLAFVDLKEIYKLLVKSR